MKLAQLKMLVAVADCGGFSAAAAELNCTQSSISHAITALEQHLGVRLLVRAQTGSVPTDAGHRVLEQARQMLRLEAAMRQGAVDSRAVQGRVRVACFRSVGTHLLPHALEALAREYPAIQVDIDDSCEDRCAVTDAVANGSADLGVAQLPVDARFVSRDFLHDDYALVVPASLNVSLPVTWDQLDGLPFILLSCSGAAAILERCRAAGFTAEPSRSLANDTSIAAMVGRGMGYAILPRLAAFPVPEDVRIVDLPLPARRLFSVIGLPDRMRVDAVRIVARFIGDKRIIAKTRAYRSGVVSFDAM